MTNIGGFLRRVILVAALALLAVPGAGATLALACKENAMLVFDSSGSMSSIRNGLPKIVV